ncbi:hypothetical protein PQX77_009482 [Marasmius sp. AFHP31]|nr:hypothetical protein PQX77_009482 [Marasmius sp. AFHP31]
MGQTVGVQPAIAAKYALNVAPAALIHKKIKGTRSKRPPMTRAERKRRRLERQTQYTAIKIRMAKLRRLVREECVQLGKDFRKKPRYFTDMFFQGGTRIHKPANKPSSFNAFISKKSRECRAAGNPLTLRQIQQEFTEEYNVLTPKERQDLVVAFEETRDLDTRERLKRPSVQEKMADAAASFSQIAGIGLKTRVGVEAVVLAVKNRPEKIMAPKWIFTDDRIRHYLPTIVRGWNTATIGKKVEALAVAGCDPTKLIQNQAEQADALKKELAQLIQEALDEACSTTNQAMHYERFDTLVTLRYGVVCEGWPKDLPFQKPSSFGGNNESLFQLRDAWRDGNTVFRKLSKEELADWKLARAKGIEEGTVVLKQRKKRRDAGQKRGPKGKGKEKQKDAESGEDSEEEVDGGELDEREPSEITPASTPSAAKDNSAKTAKAAAKKKPSGRKAKAASSNNPEAHVTFLPPPSPALDSPCIDPPRPKPRRKLSERERAAQVPPTEANPTVVSINQVIEAGGNVLDAHDRSGPDNMVIDPRLLGLDPVEDSCSGSVVLTDPLNDYPSGPVIPTEPSLVSDQSPVVGVDESTITVARSSDKKRRATVAEDSLREERPKRARTATRRKHLGASTHPASRTLAEASGEDDDA